jgi:hypothetical protein
MLIYLVCLERSLLFFIIDYMLVDLYSYHFVTFFLKILDCNEMVSDTSKPGRSKPKLGGRNFETEFRNFIGNCHFKTENYDFWRNHNGRPLWFSKKCSLGKNIKVFWSSHRFYRKFGFDFSKPKTSKPKLWGWNFETTVSTHH